MDETIQRYSDPVLLIPVGLMFVILLVAVYRTTADIPLFQGGARFVLAFCVTSLAIYGFDRAIVQTIVNNYVVMGAAILISIAGLILTTWRRVSKQSTNDEHIQY
ncbi:MAG: hypothetical protein L6Q92_05755 [Phycisphaerae bacterium]|nr:hypothetical protein [Phycisphaerae bacterium]